MGSGNVLGYAEAKVAVSPGHASEAYSCCSVGRAPSVCSCSPRILGQPDGQYLSRAKEKPREKQKLG